MAMTKKVVSFFQEKNRVTQSVAAPGNTNPSDATDRTCMAEVKMDEFVPSVKRLF